MNNEANAIWEERYKAGELVGTQKTIKNDPIDYTQHAFLYQHSISKRLTGALDGDPLRLVAERFLTPAPSRVLAIGSGMAFTEEWLVAEGFAEHVLAFEFASAAVEAANNRLAESGLSSKIEVRAGDVLKASLTPGSFDVVFVQAAIHHFFEIDKMYRFMHRMLKPNGLLIFDEYIGPDHHQYGPEIISLCNAINACLADKYRVDALRNNSIRPDVPFATMDWMMQMDPSEGVHASRIMPLTRKWFDIEYQGDYGGTVMRPFWVGILPNFDFTDERDQTIARLIVLVEELMLKQNVIPHYHTRVVARRKPAWRAALSSAH